MHTIRACGRKSKRIFYYSIEGCGTVEACSGVFPSAVLAAAGRAGAPGHALRSGADDALSSAYARAAEHFDLLYAAACQREKRVWLPEGVAYQDADAAADALICDCPELCALENRYAVGYYQDEPDVAIYVTLYYGLPQEAQDTLLREASALSAELSDTDWARAAQLEEFLCQRAVYDADAPGRDSAYGALVDGRAACEGYARAMMLLARLAGIPCGLVTGEADAGGTAQLHAWNIMLLDGVYVQADPTWDDLPGHGATHWYFGLSDAQMAADHRWQEALPVCGDARANWHARTGQLMPADKAAAQAIFREAMLALVRGGTAANLRFEDAAMYANFVEDASVWLDEYDRSVAAEDAFHGAYRVVKSDAQQCVILMRD